MRALMAAVVLVLSSGCATAGAGFLGVAGSIGPIAVSADGKSTVKLTAGPVEGVAPKCVKPVEVEFRAPDWGLVCAAPIPVPVSAAGTCR